MWLVAVEVEASMIDDLVVVCLFVHLDADDSSHRYLLANDWTLAQLLAHVQRMMTRSPVKKTPAASSSVRRVC